MALDFDKMISEAKLARQSYGIAMAQGRFGGPAGIWLECTSCDDSHVIVGSNSDAWAAVPTKIGDEDLRPYLFVAKDRKDYFGAASVLGHLATVVEQLFGGKFAVQGLEADLKRLASPEAAQVFEAVRGRIVGGDSFDIEPPGAAGLAILVKAQPTLQRNLVDFLDALPRDRLGPWVCSGWEGVLKDPDAAQRFDRLLQLWGKEGGAMLKAAANGVLRTRQGAR